MAERLDLLIHTLEFAEAERPNLAFSDATRLVLVSDRNVVEIRPDARGRYPTDAGLNVISGTFRPGALRGWVGFDARIDHKRVTGGTTYQTSAGFRLHDGANQFWWNGTAWVVNTTNWNTEAEVQARIGSFPTTSGQLRVVVNLVTSDTRVTPTLRAVKVAWRAKVGGYLEDVLYRSLVPDLRAKVRYVAACEQPVVAPGGTSLPLGALHRAMGIPYNFADVGAVFDEAGDPAHRTNLATAYVPGASPPATASITLSTPIAVGQRAFIEMIVEPEIVVQTRSPDFVEVERVPAVVLRNMRPAPGVPTATDEFLVTDRATGAALRLPAPYRQTLRFEMLLLAPGALDLVRLQEAVLGYFMANASIRSVGLDRRYALVLTEEPETTTPPGMADLHASRCVFEVRDVLTWRAGASASSVVLRLRLRGDMDVDGPPT